MRILRIKAYIIDFLVVLLALGVIQFCLPKSKYVTTLEVEQSTIMEDYLAHRISYQDYLQNYGEVYYQISLEQQTTSLLYFLFMISYFVLLPYFWKGRTVGCYLCNVEVERFDQGVLHPWQLFVRYSFTFGLFYLFLSNVLLLVLPSQNYFSVISILSVFQFVLVLFNALTILIRKEKRGLHELLSNTELTKIIDKKKIEELEKQKILMAEQESKTS